jgi:hypothetical protein
VEIAKVVCFVAPTAWLGLLTNAAQAQFLPTNTTVDFFSGGDLIAGYANSHDFLLQINGTNPVGWSCIGLASGIAPELGFAFQVGRNRLLSGPIDLAKEMIENLKFAIGED